MNFKKFVAAVLVVSVSTALFTGCRRGGEQADQSGDTYTLQVGHVVTADHSYHLGLERFAELLDEKTNGRVQVEIFPAGQLGNEADLIEGLTMGTIDMALCNSGNLASFTDAYEAFDLPFLFRDEAHAHAVLDSEIGQAALDSLESVGIKGLSNWENGFFCTWNNKRPIETPEDMKGLKIRANNNPIHIAAYKELGVSAITMGWSEVYTAIQNGTVDGVSVSIPSMYTANIQEVAPYISNSGEFYVTVILMMSMDRFNSLPEDIQTALLEAAKEATSYQREVNAEQTSKYLQALRDAGYTVTDVDKSVFKDACWDAIYARYGEAIGEEKIQSILNDY